MDVCTLNVCFFIAGLHIYIVYYYATGYGHVHVLVISR